MREKYSELSWAECEFIFLRNLVANNQYSKELGEFFVRDCQPFFRRMLQQYAEG